MFDIARKTIVAGLMDAKFLFLSALILVIFTANGYFYSERYQDQLEDYRATITETMRLMEPACGNLQDLAVFNQPVKRPPSSMSFVADGGDRFLPNVVQLNAFRRWETNRQHSDNERSPVLPALDWTFIIGSLMTLLTVLVSYSSIAGEKQSGTLRMILSNPISRLKLLLGKYLGLMSILLMSLFVGMLASLVTIYLMDGPPLNQETLWIIGWAILLSVLTISFFLLAGMAVSSVSRNPAVALVVILVIWIIAVVAVPGIGRLLAEQLINVPSDAQIRLEIETTVEEMYKNVPPAATGWTGDPFDPMGQVIKEFRTDIDTTVQRIEDRYLDTQVSQALAAQRIALVSPSGLLTDSLQYVCGTGVYGLQKFIDTAERYRRQLLLFIEEQDALDNDSPHLVFGFRSSIYSGAFSDNDVSIDSVPKSEALWSSAGFSGKQDLPTLQIVILLALNLNVGLLSFIALTRTDPR